MVGANTNMEALDRVVRLETALGSINLKDVGTIMGSLDSTKESIRPF